jgi:Ca2+-binding EF-hand superfamily protein
MLENDTDGDGKISKAEAPERMQGFFDNLDGDSDGFVTKDEMEAMSKRWRGGGSRGGGGEAKAPKRPGAAE